MQAIAFYMFAIVAVVAGTLVVFAKNPVHSVLWLILAFFSTAGLFVLMGAEFLAMLLMIIYVGAVAVLFLFVVMMLDIDFAELRGSVAQYLPLGLAIGVILMVELTVGFAAWTGLEQENMEPGATYGMSNAHALGSVVYTKYVYAFQASGLILLVAMIGAIVLTLRTRTGVRKQDVWEQMQRDPKTAVEMKDVRPGQSL